VPSAALGLKLPSAPSVALIYTALSVALTWPLAAGLASDVPGDLGDSLLNMWILAWGAEHLPRVATGAMSWSAFWNANIFHPEPLTLALSEHLVGQVLQILPVYWLTGNVILAYNLLFIATFALSAFGAFLLVRDLTGSARAAFLAGLIYGFLPYRIASVPHLQVMSSQWMPLALWGLNRFITLIPESRIPDPRSPIPDPRSPIPASASLALGTAALVMQNLSCGYYLLYFAPFVPAFAIFRMWTLGLLANLRVWIGLAASAAVTLALTLPFLLPYRAAQEQFGFERPFGEVVQYSANLWSYVTASEYLVLWGSWLRAYPQPEGETFLGFMPWLLALAALVCVVSRFSRIGGATPPGVSGFNRIRRAAPPVVSGFSRIDKVLAFLAATQLLALASLILFGGFELGPLSVRTPMRVLFQLVAITGVWLAVSPAARARAARALRAPATFFLAAALIAMWLSLGPRPRSGDVLLATTGPYNLLYEHVPGFNGVRVPARYAMIAGLFLAVAAGYGARQLSTGNVQLSTAALLILLEGLAVPMALNRTWSQNETMPPARVLPHSRPPAVYAGVAALPAGSVITEFPFGDPAWEIRYVYYAAAHWKPITNGYSGAFPAGYRRRVALLQRLATDPEAAWQTLIDSGTTHVVLHRNAFANGADADAVQEWLHANGARELNRFTDGDMLFALRP